MHIMGEAPKSQILDLRYMGLNTVLHNIIISPATFVVAYTGFMLFLCACVCPGHFDFSTYLGL